MKTKFPSVISGTWVDPRFQWLIHRNF